MTEEEISAIVEEKLSGILTRVGRMNIDSQPFTLFPNYVEIPINGVKKAISLLDFKMSLDRVLQTETKMEQLALPYNCFSFGKTASEIHLSCYHPEKIMEVSHISTHGDKPTKYKIPFPNTIISYTLRLQEAYWSLSQAKYFCTDKKVTQLPEGSIILSPSPAEGVWGLPFPNFYPEGAACYGGNTMPVKFTNNLRGLDYYYQVIFSSPFNNDLGVNSVQTRINPKDWFQKLAALKEFPYELLRKN